MLVSKINKKQSTKDSNEKKEKNIGILSAGVKQNVLKFTNNLKRTLSAKTAWNSNGCLLQFTISEFSAQPSDCTIIDLSNIILGFRIFDILVDGKLIIDQQKQKILLPININFKYEMQDPLQSGVKSSHILFSVPIQKPIDFYGMPLKQLLFSLPMRSLAVAEYSDFNQMLHRWEFGINLQNVMNAVHVQFVINVTGHGYAGKHEEKQIYCAPPVKIIQVLPIGN